MPDDQAGVLDDFSVGDALILGFLTMIGVVGFYLSPVSVEAVAYLDAGALVGPSLLFLGFMAFPMAWVANMSFEGFRIESLAAFIVLPGVFRGGFFAVVCLALPLAVVFGSYVARSTYNGRNPFWVSFKVGAALVSVLAIVTASAGAYTMMGDGETRSMVREGVSEYVSDRTTEVVNESFEGGTDNGALEQQRTMIVDMAERVARNVSSATLVTSQRSLEAVMDQVEGTPQEFSEPQRGLIDQTMTGLRQELPANISGQVRERVDDQVREQMEDMQPSTGDIQEQVQQRVDDGLDVIFENDQALAGVTFFVLLSTIMLLKIPFELIAGVLGYLLYRAVA